MDIRLQPKQEEFLSSPADIVIGGGGAGGGKTYALLTEPLRHVNRKGFNSVLFRRSYAEVTKAGGAWDVGKSLYIPLGATALRHRLKFIFPKTEFGFGYLANDDTLDDWKSSQIALLLFDQLETLTERMFFYMLSRNRTMCGIRAYVRATANPEPNWLSEFISWWIADDGYADLSRTGKIRWFHREQESIIWGDSREELKDTYPDSDPLSVSYIPFTVYDNPILMNSNPKYLANLKGLGYVDRERLLGDRHRGGNWYIKVGAGKIFNRDWFEIIPEKMAPEGGIMCRYFDTAGTMKKAIKDDPDYTAGVLMQYYQGKIYVWDSIQRRVDPAKTEDFMVTVAENDLEFSKRHKSRFLFRWEEEPGSASKRESVRLMRRLHGIDARGIRKRDDKLTAWKPLAAQALAGNVILISGAWNKGWITHMHGQPEMPHDDVADASAGSYTELIKANELGEQVAEQARW